MRRKDREIKDFDTIIDILSRSKILHLALISDVSEDTNCKKLSIYFHGAGEGKKIEAIKENPIVSFCTEAYADVSGSDAACYWTCYYESIIGLGNATILQSRKERTQGLDSLMLHNGYKLPAGVKFIAYNALSLAKTAVVRIDVTDITGKCHFKK